MEKLIINIPETKIVLVKQILKELGVVIQQDKKADVSGAKEKLAHVSIWGDDDIKVFDETKKAFESLKPQQW